MKDKIIQALEEYFEGSKKLARYAYYLLEKYIDIYLEEDNMYDGNNFFDWGQYESDKDDYTYTAFYTLYDYGADTAAGQYGAISMFENIIEIYIDNME